MSDRERREEAMSEEVLSDVTLTAVMTTSPSVAFKIDAATD